MSRLRTLRDRRGQVVEKINALGSQAGENALTPEQRTEYDRLWDEQEQLAGDIRREEQAVEAQRELQSTPETRRRGAAGNGEQAGDEDRGQGLSDEELRALEAEIDGAEDVDQSTLQTRRTRAPERAALAVPRVLP
jgi:hypothetical protein